MQQLSPSSQPFVWLGTASNVDLKPVRCDITTNAANGQAHSSVSICSFTSACNGFQHHHYKPTTAQSSQYRSHSANESALASKQRHHMASKQHNHLATQQLALQQSPFRFSNAISLRCSSPTMTQLQLLMAHINQCQAQGGEIRGQSPCHCNNEPLTAYTVSYTHLTLPTT